MTILIILFIIILLLAWFFKKSNDQSLKHQFNEDVSEDHNYQGLKKLFFAVNSNNINSKYLNNSKSVFGVLIEGYLADNKKILFASYITGFAGFYQSQGGGLIGGKWYPENDRNVQQELMRLCESKNLNGERQQIDTRKMAVKLCLRCNDFLNRTVLDNGWSENINTIKFWFLTKEGVYFSEVEKTLLNNSNLKELVSKGYDIVNELQKT